ncbi:MAG: hypothetical protein CM15mP25_3130 [Gammaproteobacteria bacterium]|nr:MAG: hypothetical protein CM15mP25_3130 [Gammaproteobacteria bacterium]
MPEAVVETCARRGTQTGNRWWGPASPMSTSYSTRIQEGALPAPKRGICTEGDSG